MPISEAHDTQPLTETTFYIILSLSDQPKHGYAIMKDVQLLSDQRVVLSTGTLYGALKRLLEQGWIERVDDPDETETSPSVSTERLRKAYTLTPLGRYIFNAEYARLNQLVQTASLRIAGSQI